MSAFQSPRFLRNVLLLDAASVLLTGAPQVIFTARLAAWTGLPSALLLATGAFLLAYGIFAIWIATRRPIPAALVRLVIAGNLAWGVACLALLAAPPFALTGWGVADLLLNVVAVTLFAALQWLGVRQPAPQWGVAR